MSNELSDTLKEVGDELAKARLGKFAIHAQMYMFGTTVIDFQIVRHIYHEI